MNIDFLPLANVRANCLLLDIDLVSLKEKQVSSLR